MKTVAVVQWGTGHGPNYGRLSFEDPDDARECADEMNQRLAAYGESVRLFEDTIYEKGDTWRVTK